MMKFLELRARHGAATKPASIDVGKSLKEFLELDTTAEEEAVVS